MRTRERRKYFARTNPAFRSSEEAVAQQVLLDSRAVPHDADQSQAAAQATVAALWLPEGLLRGRPTSGGLARARRRLVVARRGRGPAASCGVGRRHGRALSRAPRPLRAGRRSGRGARERRRRRAAREGARRLARALRRTALAELAA